MLFVCETKPNFKLLNICETFYADGGVGDDKNLVVLSEHIFRLHPDRIAALDEFIDWVSRNKARGMANKLVEACFLRAEFLTEAGV